MQVHRPSLRLQILLVITVASFITVFLGSRAANPAAKETQSPSIPTDSRQVATSGEEGTSSVESSSGVAQSDSDETDCEHLPKDYPLRLKLNGRRLPLQYDGLRKGSERSLLEEAKVLPLSGGRLLAGLGDTLYMLDQRKHVAWKYKPSWILWDFAVVESTGLVYGAAGDGIMFILDDSTGKCLLSDFQNGRANHLQVVPFGEDMCLINNSMAGYRDALDEWAFGETSMIETDEITAWRGTEVLWSLDFPPDADLVVRGDKIYAVTKTDKSIYVREIIPPKTGAK